jgi:hypothetical protein
MQVIAQLALDVANDCSTGAVRRSISGRIQAKRSITKRPKTRPGVLAARTLSAGFIGWKAFTEVVSKGWHALCDIDSRSSFNFIAGASPSLLNWQERVG